MDLLIAEPLEPELIAWLEERHAVRVAPELAFDPRALRDALRGARAAIVPPSAAIDSQVLYQAPRLRAVGRVSAGAENIDLDACARAGVEVVRSLSATAAAEAEFMVGALLTLLRRDTLDADGRPSAGRELGASKVGLIGMAPSARVTAQLLAAFGARVVGYDPGVHASDAVWKRWHIEPLGLRELFERCDAVCVQLAYYSRWRGLLGERIVTHARPRQVLVSIAHAALFDEAALANALRSGRMAAAWLDSVEPGMLDEGRPLASAPNLQVSARVASTTRESRLRSAWVVVQRIDELLRGSSTAIEAFRVTSPGVPADLQGGPASP